MNKQKLFKETSQFISKNNFDFFITLHFKNKVSKEHARKSLDKFIKKLNNELFGSRSSKSISQISAIEKNTDCENYHIHIALKCPLSRIKNREHANVNYLKRCIKNAWRSADKSAATDELNLFDKNPKWIRLIYDNVGISEYISKQILNDHFDVIEWDKTNLSTTRTKS